MMTTPKTTAAAKTTAKTTAHGNLADALSAFQKTLPQVVKDATADVPTKSGGSYSYQFADLATVSRAVLPALAEQGLAWIAVPTYVDGMFVLDYSLRHGASGESVGGVWPLPNPANTNVQQVGSAITYAKRYALSAVTGVAPDADDDGAAAGRSTPAAQKPVQRPVAQAPAAPEYLPAGLYDLSGIFTRTDAENMFYTARRAGHLNFLLRVEDRDVPFGKWLQDLGTALGDDTEPDEDADAIAAHEAEIESQG